MLNRIRTIIEKRDTDKSSFVDCLEQITGRRYGESNARKTVAILRLICKQATISDVDDPHGKMKSLEVNSDGSRQGTFVVDVLRLKDKSPVSLLTFCGYDPAQWAVKKFRFSDWQSPRKKETPQELYALKMEMEPLQQHISSSFLRELYVDLKPHKLPTYEYEKGNLLLEIVMYDFHLGKLAWAEESGEDYDLNIAEQIYKETLLDIVSQVKAYGLKIDRIIYPIGNDFFHVDNEKNETTKGTPQDVDTRWQKMFRKGCDISLWAIELLRSIAPVECPYIESNHDGMLGWLLAEWIDAYYRETDNVSIDTTCYPRKYREYGKCLIGLSHNHLESKKQLESAMQDEKPEAWGRTIFREWHIAHKHTGELWEVPGVIIRRYPALCGAGKWSKGKALSSSRQGLGILWDKERGKKLEITHNIV